LEKNGLNYADFIRLNAKIGAIYSVVNAEYFMENIQKQVDEGKKQLEDGIKLMQEQIDNPEVAQETKEELRKSIEELKVTKEETDFQYGKNKLQADLVLKRVKRITNQYISEEDIELVNSYYDEITQAYTGGVQPVNFSVE
jgi:predicted  nucleic acid-binding Zn-ribbon protein